MAIPGPESASRKILAVKAKSTNPGLHGMENLLAGVSEAQMSPNILNLGTISRKVNRIKQLGLMQARLWIKMTWTISLKSPFSWKRNPKKAAKKSMLHSPSCSGEQLRGLHEPRSSETSQGVVAGMRIFPIGSHI